jgi:hypothetical protein
MLDPESERIFAINADSLLPARAGSVLCDSNLEQVGIPSDILPRFQTMFREAAEKMKSEPTGE